MNSIHPIADWIYRKYKNPKKIVEIGIGNYPIIFLDLKKCFPKCNLIATDIEKKHVSKKIDPTIDNITNPNQAPYKGADLLYSIRPPYELYKYILELAEEIESDVLIMPLSSEESPVSGKLVNHSGNSFYFWNKKQLKNTAERDGR
ncbi:MAG: UPF0146 family protein [Candidatus Hadarchaeia archaeon]